MKLLWKYFSLILHFVFITWTGLCVLSMWRADATGQRYGIDYDHLGNLPSDLSNNLMWMIADIFVFYIAIRPDTYILGTSFRRVILVLPLSIIGLGFHLLQTWHAGSVHGWMAGWMLGLVIFFSILLVISLMFYKKSNSNQN